MRIVAIFFLASLVLIGATASAGAAPITVTEVTDFSNSGPGNIVGILDVGTNTVSGHWSAVTADGDTGDYFSLVLPAGMKVTFISILESNVSCCSGGSFIFFPKSEWTTDGPGSDNSPWGMGPGLSIGLFAGTPNSPTGPLTFFAGVSGYSFMIFSGEVTGGGFDWQATYEVKAVDGDTTTGTVPEPGGLSLLGLGLTGATIRLRRSASGRFLR